MENVLKPLLQVIEEIEIKQKELARVKSNVYKTVYDLCKLNNICPYCLGEEKVKNHSSAFLGMIYSESPAFLLMCSHCGGTGKFMATNKDKEGKDEI